jgi:hypothetical protein
MEVIQMTTVPSNREANGQLTLDHVVEEVPNVLPVADAGEPRVLATQAVAAMERNGGDKPRLARGKAKGI